MNQSLIFFILFFILKLKFQSALDIELAENNYNVYTDFEDKIWLLKSKSYEKVIGICNVTHISPEGINNYSISINETDNEFLQMDNSSCTFEILNASSMHLGKWIFTADNENISKSVTVYEKKEVKPLPSEVLFVNQNDYITFKINKSDIFKKCYDKQECLTYSQENTFDLKNVDCHLEKLNSNIELDMKNIKNEDYENIGLCEIKMLAKPDKIGTWLLTVNNNYTKIYAYVKIIIGIKLYWEINSRQVLKLNVDNYKRNQESCELINPNNELIKLNSNHCEYKIRKVNYNHNGNWTGRFLPKSLITISEEKKFIIKVFENQKSVQATLQETFKIECTVLARLNNCSIQSPNGTLFPATIAGTKMDICRLTIHFAHDSHSGIWTCHFNLFEGLQLKSNVTIIVEEPSNFFYIIGLMVLIFIIILSILIILRLINKRN
ncbi:hypothetical protein HCN44_000082 [Aphidius gifuensis]|uniref:Uncharacterized protein n=1 Tax=Aphidius gifuensis TaxID=684658 RepID=A0A834XRC8_APHGI|nr:uncharacterized protein LOC122855350 [Aphidius gifuensis]KAF7990277.1 hypothetical protein HCN44_000082 [Aphidius gifuensis]